MKKSEECKSEELEFLFEVYASSRLEEVEAWGWEENQIVQFLQMQFLCQQRSYEFQYPNLQTIIIDYQCNKAGRLLLAELERKFIIIDITLLPGFQNKGVGTKIISKLLEKAKEQNKVVQLSVFYSNDKAKKLYERLGFRQVGMDQMYILMEWACEQKEKVVVEGKYS